MLLHPGHWAWKRERQEFHGGAIRVYMKDSEDDGLPRGPDATPKICARCSIGIEYDSAFDWYLSSSSDSSYDERHPKDGRMHSVRLQGMPKQYGMKSETCLSHSFT